MKHLLLSILVIVSSLWSSVVPAAAQENLNPLRCGQPIQDYIYAHMWLQIFEEFGFPTRAGTSGNSFTISGHTATVTNRLTVYDRDIFNEPRTFTVPLPECYWPAEMAESPVLETLKAPAWTPTSVEAMTHKLNSPEFDGQTITFEWKDGAGQWHFSHTATVGFQGDISLLNNPGNYEAQESLGTYAIDGTDDTFFPSAIYRARMDDVVLLEVVLTEDIIGYMPEVYVTFVNADLMTPRSSATFKTATKK